MTVSPRAALESGDSVAVHGTGFPAGATALLQCAAGAAQIQSCDLATLQIVETPADGTFDATITVRRSIRVSGNRLRCWETPDSCAIAVANVDDQTQNHPELSTNAPAVTLGCSGSRRNPVDHQSVAVSGTGFVPGRDSVRSARGSHRQRRPDDGDRRCQRIVHDGVRGEPVAGPSTVNRIESACARNAVDFEDAEYDASVPLGFDPNGPPPLTPSISVCRAPPLTPTRDGLWHRLRPMTPVRLACAPVSVNGCASSSAGFATADASGSFSIELLVRRLVGGGGPDGTQAIDCAPTGCEVEARAFTDIDPAAIAPIEFDPSVPAAPPPTITVAPTTNLGYREVVAVHGEGLTPGTFLFASQCGNSPAFGVCVGGAAVAADASGAITITILVNRFLG
jgi:hypothetical protein